MSVSIPAKMTGLLKIAKEHKFPDSALATEILTHWIWNLVEADGDDDPENSELADEIGEAMGISYLDLLELGNNTLETELNSAMTKALDDRKAFLRACTITHSNKFANKDEFGIECEWSLWCGYDRDDLVTLPKNRVSLFETELPFVVLELVNIHSRKDADIIDFEKEVRRYFEATKTEFCFPRSLLIEIDENYSEIEVY
jgi:hypothetical protein